jgi:hypothetical protein
MLKNTFSKKGWIGAAVLAITLGFLGAFGADLYSLSRATMIRFPFQSIILFVLLLIGRRCESNNN